MDELRFWKYHGTGNDFVLLEDVAGRFELGEELARRLCDRRFGIGLAFFRRDPRIRWFEAGEAGAEPLVEDVAAYVSGRTEEAADG